MMRTGTALFTSFILVTIGAMASGATVLRVRAPSAISHVLSPDSDGLLYPPCPPFVRSRPPSVSLRPPPSLPVRSHMEHTDRPAPVTKGSGGQARQSFVPRRLSAFARAKAEGYLADRYPCLGCHRLNGEGGQIGPDLTDVGRRRAPSYIYEMIRDPQTTLPGTVMPLQLMPTDRIELLASYLVGEGQAGAVPGSPSLADRELPEPPPDLTTGAGLYSRYCASCHGTSGNADGYNAGFLPVAPTNHADSSAMSLRPDDTLFDGIHAGGYILGKSHRMPAFGQMFSSAQIRSLVAYIRQLCGCEQPEWARR